MTMVTTIKADSGRVDSLSPEQEAKVQEFWQIVITLWRAKPDALDRVGSANGTPPRTISVRSTSSPSRIKDKSRPARKLSLVGRTGSQASVSTISSANTRSGASDENNNGDDYDMVGMEQRYGLLKDFNRKLSALTPDQIRRTFYNMVKHENPDALLLRFLRANHWDSKNALAMLISSIHWRCSEVGMDDLLEKGDGFAYQQLRSHDSAGRRDAREFVRQLHIGKGYLHGHDKEDRPIIYIQVHKHKPFDQSRKSLERYIAYHSELSILMKRKHQETVVSEAISRGSCWKKKVLSSDR